MLNSYIYRGTKKLRCGFTTGSCAAGAAKAAANMLLSGRKTEQVTLMTPAGIPLTLDILEPVITGDSASCAVRKDSGDDPDITNGILIYAKVSACESGITISGGEPFQQPEALLRLLQNLHRHDTPPILVFSGFPYSTLYTDSACSPCLELIDALICGPYRRELPPAYERFCSSANQELILLSDRYSIEDFSGLPLSECIIGPDGATVISGISGIYTRL